MKRTLFFSMAVLVAAAALACTGEVTTTADLTASPALSPQPASQVPTQAPLPATGVPPTATATATPIPGPTPIPSSASFSIDVESGSAPHTVEFSNTFEGFFKSVEWDFGDGTSSTDESPSHRYTIAGTYSVTLSIAGPGGDDSVVKTSAVIIGPGPAVTLEIDPPSVTLAVQEGTQFSAIPRDEFGNVVPGTIAWSVTGDGGSITNSGIFTADTLAGEFTDNVGASFESDAVVVAASASVTVKPGPMVRVQVDPLEINLDIGGTQQFTFMAFDVFDNETTDVIAAWTVPSDLGDIELSGEFTAGAKAGVFADVIRVDVVEGTRKISETADLSILPGTLISVEVRPKDVIMTKGDEQPFAATGVDQYGNEIPDLAFLWEATGGNMHSDGFSTATGKGGRYELVATAKIRDGTGSGTAIIRIPPTDYINWWPGEGNADDKTGNNDGRLHGVSFVPGISGRAFGFDARSNDMISIPYSSREKLTDEFSLSFWAKVDGLARFSIAYFIDNGAGDPVAPFGIKLAGNGV